jgi:hypothetical protein
VIEDYTFLIDQELLQKGHLGAMGIKETPREPHKKEEEKKKKLSVSINDTRGRIILLPEEITGSKRR